jgi:hypothetical protein
MQRQLACKQQMATGVCLPEYADITAYWSSDIMFNRMSCALLFVAGLLVACACLLEICRLFVHKAGILLVYSIFSMLVFQSCKT